jgi:tRNA G18 (ribose-2'-O)-methylase SpoU
MPRLAIDDLADPRLAPYRELNERNLTRHSGQFIAEGDKLTERLIASRYPVASLLAELQQAERLAPSLPPETPIYVVSKQLLQATIGFNFHRGVLACGRRLPGPSLSEVVGDRNSTSSTILICPEIHDPTNLGSILRTSAAFGCRAVVLGERCADPFSRRALRVSMGAAFQLPIVESRDLAADLATLQATGYTLAATVLDPAAEPLGSFRPPPKLAILLGSEGHGLTREQLAPCDRRLTIPMQLGTDSLNVAVAAAVLLYHCSVERSATGGTFASS